VVYIVMGVSGSGKTTIGKIVAQMLGLPFYDGDDYQPEPNVAKMRQGIPLTEEDRTPWLETLAAEIVRWNAGGGGVLACSALRKRYRRLLSRDDEKRVFFIYLHAPRELLKKRLQERRGHYFGWELLQSQIDALEIPEDAVAVDVEAPPHQVARQILAELAARGLAQ
jgi:carbohydrate kinase (thermoresistant glucokinase family)